MSDRRHLLKLKLKSLAAEAKIIRAAERKLQIPNMGFIRFTKEERERNPDFVHKSAVELRRLKAAHRAKFRSNSWYGENRAQLESIHNHRAVELREAARATHLAYGFIRGKTYQQIEGSRQWKHVFEGQLCADEMRVLEKAERMAWFYGPMDKATAKVLFEDWRRLRGVTLVYQPMAGFKLGVQLDAEFNVPSDSDGTALAAPSTP